MNYTSDFKLRSFKPIQSTRKINILLWPIAIISFSLLISACQTKEQSLSNTSYIDIDIGGVGHLLQPTRPTVQLPNQMVRMYPIRKDYIDDQISWFPMSTISHRNGELFGVKPVNGAASLDKWNHRLSYDHDLEVKKPWHYSAWLVEDEIQVKYVPGAKSGMFRFGFNSNDFSILFKTIQSGSYEVKDGNVIEGVEEFRGMKAYVYAICDQDSELSTGEIQGTRPGITGTAWITNNKSGVHSISIKYGFSFISIEQAKQNLEQEIPGWDMEGLKVKGKKDWENKMDRIQVKGGSAAQRRTFYTSLYRTYERMINMNEGGRYYSGYDHEVHEAERDFYADDWVWDTYLAHHPLRMILHPDMEADMLQSYALMYQQSGWMPQFPLNFW